MARKINRLSAQSVAKETKPGAYLDGQGLYLRVGSSGSKSWLFCFMLAGRSREMGLGSADLFSLKEARDKAHAARQKVHAGIDPIEERNTSKAALRANAAKSISFKEAAERFIKAHEAGWKSDKHAAQWTATLTTYAYPLIGSLHVDQIETAHIIQVLEPIWSEKTETAVRLRGRMEQVLDWAKVRGFRAGENPARWKGHLDKSFPARSKVAKVKHREALPYADMPDFMARLRNNDSISARALEFAVLTAARTGEIIGATDGEIDAKTGVWTIPADRMKGGKEHQVPLCPRALEILKSVPREKGNPFLFGGARKGKGLSNMAMLALLQGMDGCADLTVHGFRSSFRDWAGDMSSFPREVIEAALAHSLKGVEAAYRRGDALAKRRKLMDAWAGYCAQPRAAGGNVRAIRGGAS